MNLIVLDRDGVINEDSDSYVKSPEEWHPLGGSLEAVARLNHSGYRVVIATNQSGLARGILTIDDLNAIHQKMHLELDRVGGHIEAIFFCPHGPDEGCECRKPRPGMLHAIAKRFHRSLVDIPVVGDSLRDLQSALAVQARPILVRTGKGTRTIEQETHSLAGIPIYDDLASAVDALIER